MSYSAMACAGAFAGRPNSNAASHASKVIRGRLRVGACISLIEVSTIFRYWPKLKAGWRRALSVIKAADRAAWLGEGGRTSDVDNRQQHRGGYGTIP